MMKHRVDTPPVFADLLLEVGGQQTRIDVEQPGWLQDYGPALQHADRLGLILRGKRQPSVWLAANGTAPEYISRVKGQMAMSGRGQTVIRVAGLLCGATAVWLHRDGLVEVGPEPTFREA